MADMPMLAFWLGAMAALHNDQWGRQRQALALFACLAGAIFTSYFSAVLFAVVGISLLAKWKRWDLWLALAVASILMLCFLIIIKLRYGFVPVLEAPRAFSIGSEIVSGRGDADKMRFLVNSLGYGVLGAVGYGLLKRLGHGRREALAVLLMAAIAAVTGGIVSSDTTWDASLNHAVAWTGVSLTVLAALLALARSTIKRIGVPVLWLVLAIAGYAWGMPFGAARYLMPMLPPLILLLLSEGVSPASRTRSPAATG